MKRYKIDSDSAVRLDSALLYHYWDVLGNSGKFPMERTKQAYVLTHADLKAPVEKTLDEICKDPKKDSWQAKMRRKIKDDNDALIDFVKGIIGEIK